MFERLGDRGVRTACTPFLVYRGRTRHEMGLEGMLRKVALAAKFHHATWGPDELFWGELYASRRRCPASRRSPAPAPATSTRAASGASWCATTPTTSCSSASPTTTTTPTRTGPAGQPLLDRPRRRRLRRAGGRGAAGSTPSASEHAVILTADHAQSEVEAGYDLAGLLGAEWRVLKPNDANPEAAELAVSPTARAGAVYVLARAGAACAPTRTCAGASAAPGGRRRGLARRSRRRAARARRGRHARGRRGEAVIEAGVGARRRRTSCASGRAAARSDLRGGSWDLDGDLGVLGLERSRRRASTSDTHPDAARPPLGGAHRLARRRRAGLTRDRATRPSTGAA